MEKQSLAPVVCHGARLKTNLEERPASDVPHSLAKDQTVLSVVLVSQTEQTFRTAETETPVKRFNTKARLGPDP